MASGFSTAFADHNFSKTLNKEEQTLLIEALWLYSSPAAKELRKRRFPQWRRPEEKSSFRRTAHNRKNMRQRNSTLRRRH
jgi:hypothetical protein